ncbi:FtsX-like permease family protein [Maribellus maritimus]|uniref:FtsX-like permease family protein n=1 Tax=Maribellus maritimus TaxID=2870838 RepID=UPI001EEB519A|nr:FtsX-like permease family protein [Maribellus maritimus]MCG6190753.1 FtsX-like permease family protein [Maribellus maritimus]
MNLPLYIAKRYLVSKKKQNIINIISGISISGIIVGTMALIIVLSVMNGFSSLINYFFSSFDADLKITPVEGKMFDSSEIDADAIKNIPGVLHYAEIIEESAMLKYGSQQYFATIKGIPQNYASYTNIDSLIVDGEFILNDKGTEYAVVGQGVAYNLGIGLTFIDPIRIMVPKKGRQIKINSARAINYNSIFPSGIFAVLEEVDSKYVLVPFDFAKNLFESGSNISSIELGIDKNVRVGDIQKKIQNTLGEKFHVKNKYQQHDSLNKTMRSEKAVVYLILVFILIIASFNVLSSLSMLIIDKKDDIAILKSMGATSKTIRRIFLFEGWLISVLGAVIGTVLGLFICWLQIEFGFMKLPQNGSFVISAYPVRVISTDVVLIFGVVLLIGFLAPLFPVKFISNKYLLRSDS